jgi:hypothetical protein
MKTIKITKQNVNKLTEQFTLNNLTTGRASIIGTGWNDIKIDEQFFNESINNIVELLGGRQKTKETIKYKLRNEPIYGWFSNRIVFCKHNNVWTYIAGQEYTTEIKEIRKILTK